MIFINFKTYEEATGEQALRLAKICQRVSKKEKVKVILLPQAVDIFRLSQSILLPIWAQHADEVEFGPHTGRVLPEAILAAGALGTILNHSESKIPPEVIGETVSRAKKLGLKTLVCSESVEEAEEIISSQPDYLAYEPPEFIGSRETSVATAKPEVIADFVKKFSNLPVIVGAGIHSVQDVVTSLKLGAKGVLVATDVVLAKNPEKELAKLAGGFKQ